MHFFIDPPELMYFPQYLYHSLYQWFRNIIRKLILKDLAKDPAFLPLHDHSENPEASQSMFSLCAGWTCSSFSSFHASEVFVSEAILDAQPLTLLHLPRWACVFFLRGSLGYDETRKRLGKQSHLEQVHGIWLCEFNMLII